MERWHDAYCSKNCKDLYNVLAGFLNNWLSPEVEAARLSELDLSYQDKLQPWMQDAIKQLQKVDTSSAKAINAALKEDVIDDIKSENNVNEKIKEDVKPETTQNVPVAHSSIPKEFKKVDYSKKKNDYKK